MSVTDDIITAAKSNQGISGNEEKVLTFPSPYYPYEAFVAPTNDPQLRLRIRANQMFLMPRYDLLYDVPHSGAGDFVGLVFAHMRVKLFGRNLTELVLKLQIHAVEEIAEYFPPYREFAPGVDDGTVACITEIVIEDSPLDPEAEIRDRNKARNTE